MKLDQLRGPFIRNKTESVHAKSIDMAERPRDPMPSHRPNQGVQGTGLLTEKVPRRIMRSGGLGDLIVTARLDGVDQIREQDRVLDEEDGDVVSNNI